MDRSIRRLGAFLMLLFCALFAQLNYIQVFKAGDLNVKPGNIRPVLQAFAHPRGTVYTADGVVLARSVPSDDRYEYQREFPEGDLYGGITGYFNYLYGATGLELAYNDELSGSTARQQVRSVGDLFVDKDRTGNLSLTVRSDVQQVAKDALGRQRGSVVALDPATGGVLALWSNPGFDPNLLSGHDLDASTKARDLLTDAPGNPLLVKAYREVYPPGSTFKIVTGATGVASGQVTTTEPRYPVLSELTFPGVTYSLSNFGDGSCGGTLLDITAESCNTAFGQMALDLGPEAMVDGAEAFGFNERPPFDLPAVASGYPGANEFVRDQPKLAQTAIGQNDVRATPLQMALVAAGIANGGVINEPHLVDEIRDGEGDLVERMEPTQWKRATDPQTAQILRDAMREVVTRGSATALQIPDVDVGAKTGTAQQGNDLPHAWVIALAGPPGKAPTVVVAVLVEGQEGATEQTGGRVAAPIAKQVIEQALKPMVQVPDTTDPTGSTTTTPGGGTTTSTTAGD